MPAAQGRAAGAWRPTPAVRAAGTATKQATIASKSGSAPSMAGTVSIGGGLGIATSCCLPSSRLVHISELVRDHIEEVGDFRTQLATGWQPASDGLKSESQGLCAERNGHRPVARLGPVAVGGEGHLVRMCLEIPNVCECSSRWVNQLAGNFVGDVVAALSHFLDAYIEGGQLARDSPSTDRVKLRLHRVD